MPSGRARAPRRGAARPHRGPARDPLPGQPHDHDSAGYAYSYTYPGMNRVLQL